MMEYTEKQKKCTFMHIWAYEDADKPLRRTCSVCGVKERLMHVDGKLGWRAVIDTVTKR